MVKYYPTDLEKYLCKEVRFFPLDWVIRKIEPLFCHVYFMESRRTCMNGNVLEWLMELDDTLAIKLDKGLVEDPYYCFG